MLRPILAPLAGLALGIAVIFVTEMLGHALFPSPAAPGGADPATPVRLVESLSAGALGAVLVGWFAGSMLGSAAAMAIARRVLPGCFVGLVIGGLGLVTTLSFPHPEWMVVAAVVLPLLGVLVARAFMKRRLPAA